MAKKKVAEVPAMTFETPTSVDMSAQYQRDNQKSLAAYAARDAEMKKKIKEIEDEAEKELAPLRAEIFARAEAIYNFAKANRRALLRGDAKYVTLPNAGEMRWYDSPGSVQLTRSMSAKRMIETLRSLSMNSFIRMVPAIDKDEILKTPENREKASGIRGLIIRYGEFFSLRSTPDIRVYRDNVGDWAIHFNKKERQAAKKAA